MRSGTGPHGDTCANKGDSGGGFVNYINNGTTAVLVGVMSFGMNDCGRPAVATNIFLYLPWINQLLDQGTVKSFEAIERRSQTELKTGGNKFKTY